MSRVKTTPSPSIPILNCQTETSAPITVGKTIDLVCPVQGTMLTSQSSTKFENGDASQPYAIAFLGPAEVKNDSLHQKVTSYKVGSHELSQLFVTIDGKKMQLSPQRIQVQTVIQQNSGQTQGQTQAPTPYPIYDPEKVPAPWWWWAVWISILVLIVGFFVWQLVKWFKDKKREKDLAPEKELTPQEKFQSRLRKLESVGYHQKGEYKAFALELTNIIKTAIGAQFRFPAEDMTSEELLAILERRHQSFFQTTGSTLQTVFADLDQIKFAKIETTSARCMQLLDSSIKIGRDLFGGTP